LEAAWEEGFRRLRQFVDREGHARVPQRHVEDGFKLGQWVRVPRRQYKAGVLDPERQRQLEALPRWDWGARRASARGEPRHRRTRV